MKTLSSILVVCCFLIGTPALALDLDLDQAKAQGLVGEKSDGYLGLVVKRADTEKLVNEINAKRKSIYIELAKKNNITLEQVQSLAAEKSFSKTQPGHYLLINDVWVKQVAPVTPPH